MNLSSNKLELKESVVRSYFKQLRDKNLIEHYSFEEGINFIFEDNKDISSFLKSNKPLTMRFEDDVMYVTSEFDGGEESVFDIDVSTSFTSSDKWISTRLIRVVEIFSNVSSASLSSEMSSFYIALNIASVFGGVFEDEFEQTLKSYDFKKWLQQDKNELSFKDLAGEWVQIGSKNIKMLAAASRYALVREKKKKQVPSVLALPQETALGLNNLISRIENIRFVYDNGKLSASNKEKMEKLDIKVIIRERDKKILKTLQEDSELYQLWRLCNLNSNNISPLIIRDFILKARKNAPSVFEDLEGRVYDPKSDDDLVFLKKIQDKLKREAIRAAVNKLFSEQAEIYKASPKTYIAPSFV